MGGNSRGASVTSVVVGCAALLVLQCGSIDEEPTSASGGTPAAGGLSARGGAGPVNGGGWSQSGAGGLRGAEGGAPQEPDVGSAGVAGVADSLGGASAEGGASPREDGGASNGGGSAGESVGGASGAPGARCPSTLTVKCQVDSLYEFSDTPGPGIAPWVGVFDEVLDVHAINSHRQVVGRRNCGEQAHASLIDGDRTHDLLEPLNDFSSNATDINDSGVIIGSAQLTEGSRRVPFIWRAGEITLLQDPRLSTALAINNRGQVLLSGTAEAQGDFIWNDGTLTAIGVGLRARALDDAGRVVGETLVAPSPATTGFVWQNGSVSTHTEFASIRASNSNGQLAGIAPDGGAIFWDGEDWIELPEDFGVPIGLTDDGTLLGGYGHEPNPPLTPSMVYRRSVDTGEAGSGGVPGVSILPGPFYDLYAQDISQNGDVVARTMVIEYAPGSPGCRFESCESLHYYSAVWSPDCFGSCCGAGGAGGSGDGDSPPDAGAGGTSQR